MFQAYTRNGAVFDYVAISYQYNTVLYHPNRIILYPQLFKMDLVMMSIVILCIVSAILYQGITMLEKKIVHN